MPLTSVNADDQVVSISTEGASKFDYSKVRDLVATPPKNSDVIVV